MKDSLATKSRTGSRSYSTLGWIVIALVILLQLYYLLSIAVNVPYQDDWPVLDGLMRALDTHNVVAWLIVPRNGHFIPVSKFAYWSSLRLSFLNLAALRLINVVLCLLAFMLTWRLLRREIKDGWWRAYLCLGVACIIFNLCFWELFIYALGFTAVLAPLAGAVSLYYFTRWTLRPRLDLRSLLVAVVFFFIAASSFGSGYAVIPAAVVFVGIARLRNSSRRWLLMKCKPFLFYLFAAILFIALLSHPVFHLANPLLTLLYRFLLVTGSVATAPFEYEPAREDAGYVFGLVTLALTMWVIFDWIFRERPGREEVLQYFGASLILFGILICGGVALGRQMLPTTQLLSSPRYTIYPLICLLGLLLYCGAGRLPLLAYVWCLIITSYLFPTINELRTLPFKLETFRNIEVAIRNADEIPDDQLTRTLHWHEDPPGVRRTIARLKTDKLNIFHQKP